MQSDIVDKVIQAADKLFDDIDTDELTGLCLWRWLLNTEWTRQIAEPHPLTGHYLDEDALLPIRQFLARPALDMTVDRLRAQVRDAVHHAWEQEQGEVCR